MRLKFWKKSKPPSTEFIDFLKDHFKDKELIGCEVGIFKGDNAIKILENLPIDLLFLVDEYGTAKYTDTEMFERHLGKNGEWKEFFEQVTKLKAYDFSKFRDGAIDRLSKYGDKVSWQIINSVSASKMYKDRVFDFVYIDANHEYEFVKKDIELYWKKLKKGGVLGGHDFCPDFMGVVKAVLEHSHKTKKRVYGNTIEWWFLK